MVSGSVLPTGRQVNISANSGAVVASGQQSNFILSVSSSDIANYARQGNDLVIELTNGQSITIRDFFVNGSGYHSLVLNDGNTMILVDFTNAMGGADGIVDSMVANGAISAAGGLSTAAIVGLGALAAGGIAAAVASNSSDDDDNYSDGGTSLSAFSAAVADTISVGTNETYSGLATGIVKSLGDDFFATAKNVTAFAKALAGKPGEGFTAADAQAKADDIANNINTATDAAGKIAAAIQAVVDFIKDGKDAKISDADIAASLEVAVNEIITETGITVKLDDIIKDLSLKPENPTFTLYNNVSGSDVKIDKDVPTNDNRPGFQGKGKPGGIIEIFADGKLDAAAVIAKTTVDTNGNWTIADTDVELDEGDHILTIRITDPDNGKTNSTTYKLTVDTVPPEGDVDTTFTGVLSGGSHGDSATFYSIDNVKAEFKAAALLAEGEVIAVSFDGGATYKAAKKDDGDGLKWYAEGNIAAGTTEVLARVEDLAGNVKTGAVVAKVENLTIIEATIRDQASVDSMISEAYSLNGGHVSVTYGVIDAGPLNKDTGGHFADTITDFGVGNWRSGADEADRIDLSALLIGANIETYDDLTKYVRKDATNTDDFVLQIDRDGAGADYEFATLLTLQGVSDDLKTLWDNGQIAVVA